MNVLRKLLPKRIKTPQGFQLQGIATVAVDALRPIQRLCTTIIPFSVTG